MDREELVGIQTIWWVDYQLAVGFLTGSWKSNMDVWISNQLFGNPTACLSWPRCNGECRPALDRRRPLRTCHCRLHLFDQVATQIRIHKLSHLYRYLIMFQQITTTSRPTKASSWISKQDVGNPHIQVRFPTTC